MRSDENNIFEVNIIMFGSFLRKFKFLEIKKNTNLWKNVKISKHAIIEGDKSSINIGIGTVIEAGVVLSTKYGGTISIGENCHINRGAMILSYGGNIILGNHCGVNIYSILYGHGGLIVGDYVRFAAHCVVIPGNHGFDSLDIPIWKQRLSMKGIRIENDVWIGANVSILDGVKIGQGAVIGAGSVVSKNITPYSVNAGNPAREIKIRE